MAMVSKFSNFHDELSENDELRQYELSGSECIEFEFFLSVIVQTLTWQKK